MKLSTFYKQSQFPHIVLRKMPIYQQWNPLRKLSKLKKRIFRSRNKLHTIDLKYPLSKEIFLKIMIRTAIHAKKWHKSLLEKKNRRFKIQFQNPIIPVITKLNLATALNSQRKQYSLNVFRFVFFKKNWMLYNPSLVPGIVRPFKLKKKILLKIRAFKGLHNLIGNVNLNFVRFLLKKSLNMSNVTSLWNLPRTVDSLKTTVVLKLGLVLTVPIALALISQKQVSINGFKGSKIQSVAYPGDYFRFESENLPVLNSVFDIDSVSKHLNFNKSKLRPLKSHKKKKPYRSEIMLFLMWGIAKW